MELFLALNKGVHILAAIVGTGAATLEEIFYLKDIRDGKIDEAEAKQLRLTYKLMRWSIIILTITGFGILAAIRVKYGGTKTFYNPVLWAKYTIVLILLINAVLIAARKIPIWLASPISLTSWYAAFALGKISEEMRGVEFLKNFTNNFSFIEIYLAAMLGYFLAAAAIGYILHYLKKIIVKKSL